MELLELGRETAQKIEPKGARSGRRAAREVKRAVRAIERAKERLEKRIWSRIPTAVEWLLDNAYLARREGLAAADDLKRGRSLRSGGNGTYVQSLARAFVEFRPDGSSEGISKYLTGIQQVRPLSEEELSLFVPALKGELCRYLAELCRVMERDPEGAGLSREMEAVFAGLRELSSASLNRVMEEASLVEQTLRKDPAGLYREMEEGTRARYRSQVCVLARRAGLSEAEVAQRALALAEKGAGEERHIGWYLFRAPLGEEKRETSGALYVALILLPTLCLALWLGFCLKSWALFLLLLLPASDLVKNCVDFLAVRLIPPRPVHRMALERGVPAEGRTLCVIAGLLTGEGSGDSYAALLERYRLANRDSGEELRFGLLADLPDRDSPVGSRERQWVARARKAIDALNGKYGGGFFLFYREPVFQPRDERYSGWERKRGALLELTRCLRGRPTSLRVLSGGKKELAGTRYVITLDSDTALNVGAARELIGAMLHPLNRPVVDSRRRVVTGGYGLLQPRIGVELGAAGKSQFSRVFAGLGGIDPYGDACSDVYHDLFDRGSYTGKGIFDVEAFSHCLDGRFPENRILSHDLLEGAYLHAGLLEEVELTDGYPYQVISYFSRLHRWVRGDWQLLPWLGRWVRDERGQRVENPLTSVDKWKIFDNLRRSLSPVFTLFALLLGICSAAPAFGVAGGLAVVAAWSNLLLTGADTAFRGGVGVHRRYHATIVAGVGGMILQTLVQLLFLPYHAWVCLSAVCTALWRSWVSHRKMLEWVTAADSERKKGSIGSNFQAQWPAVAVGAFAMLFARFPAGCGVGLVWALSPAFAWAMSRPVKGENRVREGDRPFLHHQAALIWGYFRDWLRSEDHWLPPDNVQEKPWLGPARRTSPTNIGMALLSCVAAVDLELVEREEALERIRRMLDTVGTLPKWRGHLYNWYDTQSLAPLFPRYVSTVDSGNLLGCLITLRETLREWGEAELARRAGRLADEMDLSPLYDRERRLFTIGYDVEKGEYTRGWYDLMASEARLTSFLAVARGEVSPKHWRQLSRALMGDNDYCGMASWTGTMFEYFMPGLLLPSEEGSLMYESLSFCIYAQKRRGARKEIPWGISESGFYAFDPGLAYQYKANGVQALGLKRGLDDELVVAPYASFLALLLAPGSAVRNLRRLRDMGLEGTYGLYEAVDFTPERLPQGERWKAVRSFMAHHLGMSLVAIDNALRNNIMQARFLRDCAMGSFRELLQEKVPVGAPVMKPDRQGGPDRVRVARQSPFCRRGEGFDLAAPECHLLSNGLVSALCTDGGAVRLTDDRGESPILTRFQERYAPAGVSFFYRDRAGSLLPLTPSPLLSDVPQLRYSWQFDGWSALWTAEGGGLSVRVRLALPREERGALWTVELTGAEGGEVVCYLEPVLARERDYQAHPAYSKLSLESYSLDRGVVFSRRPRTGSIRSALAVVWDREEARVDTSRENALGRGGLRHLAEALNGRIPGRTGAVLDPCLLVRFPLEEKGPHRLRVSLGFEQGEEEALRTALGALSAAQQGQGRTEGLARSLGMTVGDWERALKLLSALAFPARQERRAPQSALWAYGVSGDLPIVCVRIVKGEEETDLFPLKAHALLSRSGFSFDLVYLLADGGSYLRPQKSLLTEAVKDIGSGQELGRKGGVHLVEAPEEGTASPWDSWAAVQMDGSGRWEEHRAAPVQPPELPFREGGEPPQRETLPSGEVSIRLTGVLPPLGWSHLLVSPGFGWLTDETGCGHLWRENAREGQITPWNNDPLAVGGPEWFLLTWKGDTHSVFGDVDGLPVTVTYGFGWARWEKEWPGGAVVTTAFVPWEGEGRYLLLTISEGQGEILHINCPKGEELYSIGQRLCLLTDCSGTRETDFEEAQRLLLMTQKRWDRLCRTITVSTPDPALDHYLNGWCLYQVAACRLLGRTSRYQNGGAYGFRDQLQDTLALLSVAPQWTRDQILRCCAHQFPEGDVQHWWHETDGEKARGVRTRISDDLLWLPYALARYVETWGDREILAQQVGYLSAQPLREEERERYDSPGNTGETGDVYTHALRAIRLVLDRGRGDHGLLKMGTGDWNDGMNEVGALGKGESVWLTWFAVTVLESFSSLAMGKEDGETVSLCQNWAAKLRKAAEAAWDGEWYLRGWYDNGKPLGSRASEECKIDSIPQSWAALAGGEKAGTALRAALDRLFDRDAGLVKLFTPPFDAGEDRPGYIKGYLPGVRENGGQYTHAAVWLALACFRMGWAEEGHDVLHALLPVTHPREVYKAEPYVLAGDVYSHPDHLGRGGWSWYTGAAGWYYQTAISGLLGITVKDRSLTVKPTLPKDWPGFTARWRLGNGTLEIVVHRGDQAAALLNGMPVEEVPLDTLTGEHWLEITVLP